jgi:hypothetical protein
LLSQEEEKETEADKLFDLNDPLTSEADSGSRMAVDKSEDEQETPRPKAVGEQGNHVLDLTESSEDGDMDNGPFETPLNRRFAGRKKAIPLQLEIFQSDSPEPEKDIVGRKNAKKQKNAPYKEHAGKV